MLVGKKIEISVIEIFLVLDTDVYDVPDASSRRRKRPFNWRIDCDYKITFFNGNVQISFFLVRA